jgi:hypothetical protein
VCSIRVASHAASAEAGQQRRRRHCSCTTTRPSRTSTSAWTGHAEPIAELRRVFDAYRPAIPYYNLRQVDARVPPLDDWMQERGGSITAR